MMGSEDCEGFLPEIHMFSRNSSPYSSARGRTSVSRPKAISKVPRQTATSKVLPQIASLRVPLKAISKQAVSRRLILEEPNASQATSTAVRQEHIVTQEEQIPPGSAYERREFVFEEESMQMEELPELPSSLFDCVANGELRMELAAKLMLHRTKNGTFNYAAYDEFVSSNVAARAVSRYDGLDGFEDPHIVGCNFMAMRLLADIGKAQMMKIAQAVENLRQPSFREVGYYEPRDGEVESEKKGQHHPESHISVSFPFTTDHQPPSANSRIFAEAERKKRRDAKLKNLPDEIETTLIDFADDMMGYGYDELLPGAVVDFENSEFYASLGTDEAERKQNFDQASREKMRWRPQLFKALQFALRDIRSYTYKESESKWIPHKRQSKKVADEMIDDGAVTGDDDDLFIADE
ncbi:unnamed protein product [Cylicocyclus nassatus]|uniref:Uncharacterized protein n=1 Tax=Cylicocyclus nassatus TaxID=53992 RepID=A0AA36H2Z2_CYLNA|nr:unnamed protein product [Cylicocyclus nassatus]